MRAGSTVEAHHLLEVIPDAAHLANMERPESITQAILDHLSSVVGRGDDTG
jgi:hypothetical protein